MPFRISLRKIPGPGERLMAHSLRSDYPQSLRDSPEGMPLLAPGVEPPEVFAMPHKSVLRLEYPVVLVREY